MSRLRITRTAMMRASVLQTETISQERYAPLTFKFSRMASVSSKLSKRSKSLSMQIYRKYPECFYNKDQCAIFEIGQRVENDILIRFRHFKSN